MEPLGLDSLIKLVSNFGVPGIIFVIWYFSERSHDRTLRQYREDMIEMRQMYIDNVELVKGYSGLARDQRDVLVMATASQTRLSDLIVTNQYCPNVRLVKDAKGTQG